MKKRVLIAILALVLCLSVVVASACDKDKTDYLAQAKKYVEDQYAAVEDATDSDYTRITSVDIDGKTYTVSWAITGTTTAAVVGTPADGSVTISVTREAEDVPYVLTATISDGTDSVDVVFNYTVPKKVDVTPVEDRLNDALASLKALYENEPTTTSESYSRVTEIEVDGETYAVSWAITGTETAAVVGTPADGSVTITVTQGAEAVNYTLTATISEDSNSVSETYNYTVPADEVLYGLSKARAMVQGLYIDESGSTAADFTRKGTIVYKNETYTVTWSVADSNGNAVDSVVVGEADEEGNVTISVTQSLDTEIKYVLTAVLTAPDGTEAEPLVYNYTVPKFEVLTYAKFIKENDETSVAVRGIVTGYSSKTNGASYNCVYLDDANSSEGGFYLYKVSEDPVTMGLKIGDTVLVKGTKDTYSGTYEITDASITIESSGSTPEATDITEIYKAAAASESGLKYSDLVAPQAKLVTIKGVTIGSEDTDNGYYYFELDGLQSYIRISSSVCPLASADRTTFKTEHASHLGYVANVTGVICVYSGAFYLTPVTVDAFEYVGLPEKDPQGEVDFEKENLSVETSILEDAVITLPTAGTAYSDVTISWALKETTYTSASLEGNILTVTLQEAAETVVLVATLTSPAGEGETAGTATKEFELSVASATKDWKDAAWAIAEASKLDATSKETSSDYYYIYGTIIDDPTSTYCNFNLSDGTTNIVVYGLWTEDGTQRYGSKKDIAELPVAKGDVVYLYGQLCNYNGTLEIVNARLQTAPEKGSSVVAPYTVAEAIEIINALEDGATTENKYYVTGTVTSIYNTKYCNFYLDTDLYVYGLYTTDGEQAYGSSKDIAEIPFKEGDTVVIYCYLMKYVKDSTDTDEATKAQLMSVTTAETEATDAEKVAAEKATLEGDTVKIDKTITLATAGTEYTDVTITWALKETYTTATLSENTLTIVCGDAAETVVLVATLTCGEATDTIEITYTVEAKYVTTGSGTAESPYTVADALGLAALLESGEYTEKVYIQGTITSIGSSGTYLSKVYIADTTDSSKTIQVYSVNYSDAVTAAYVNDTVVVYGYITNYSGTLEISNNAAKDYPTLTARTAGTSTITVSSTSSEYATVSNLSAETGLNDSTFTFSVTASEGYEIVSVTVNGTAVEATDGVYTGTVAGNTEISVTTKGENEVLPTLAASLSFTSTDNRTSQDTSSQVWAQNGITLTNDKASSTSDVANYSNPVRFYKNSTITIEYTGMVKIVFTCKSGKAFAGTETISVAGAKMTVSETTVTLEFTEAVDSVTITLTANQVQLYSLDVYTMPEA